ncbi:MAG: YkvA family protein [Bacteroidota bacterium]
MAEKKRKDIMVPQGGGTIRDLMMRLKLIVRLMGDRRVSPLLKLLPIGALVYLISPVDLVMGIPGVSALDDMAIVSLGAYLFIEFCPPDVVQEHMKQLTSNVDIVEGRGEVVDGQATDVTDEE